MKYLINFSGYVQNVINILLYDPIYNITLQLILIDFIPNIVNAQERTIDKTSF